MQVASAPSKPAKKHLGRRALTAAVVGLCAAVLAAVFLGAPTYKTTAVIAVPYTDQLGRLAIVRSAAAGVVSKPVIRRAARSLSETGSLTPASGWWARLTPSAGGAGTKTAAMLVQGLAGTVVALPGAASGTIEVTATSPTAEGAAARATAVADAFVAEQDDAVLEASRRDEAAIASRIEALQTAAISAHRRLTDLGGNAPVDVAAARSAAAAQTQAVLARRDAIKAILAAGSPPLGDGKGVPATIDAMQTIYLDQMRQLAHARETLGERHTTVISLTESVERAATKLTTEWRRLKASADAEVSAARDREDGLSKADGPTDATRQTAIAEARSAAQRADSALLRAESAAADTVPDNPFRVIARAPVPMASSGLPAALRTLLAIVAGGLASVIWFRARRTGRHGEGRAAATNRDVAGALLEDAPSSPSRAAPSSRTELETPVSRGTVSPASVSPASVPPASVSPASGTPTFRAPPVVEAKPLQRAELLKIEPELFLSRGAEPAVSFPEPIAAPEPDRIVDMPILPTDERPIADELLKQALSGVLPAIGEIEPRFGGLPTVIVAANEIGVSTTAAALALGHAAAEASYRVLIIESARPRPDLATAADPHAEPVLIDMFGGLRVALKAECCAGTLFLAPCFKDGSRIASALARSGDVLFIDELADEFDLIVIDGGRTADAAAEDWGADLALRVARFASSRDDDRLVATLGLASDALLGTIAGSVFSPRIAAILPAAEELAPLPAAPVAVQPFAVHSPLVHQQSYQQRPRPQAARSTMRRRVGLR